MSGDLDTYGSNPLWQVVDGPWRLSSYDVSGGQITFVPNPATPGRSGRSSPSSSSSSTRRMPPSLPPSTVAATVRPTSPSISSDDLPVNNGPPGTTGANRPQLVSRFNLDLSYNLEITYAPENRNSTSGRGSAGSALQPVVHPSGTPAARQPTGAHQGPPPAGMASRFTGRFRFSEEPVPLQQETINPYPFNSPGGAAAPFSRMEDSPRRCRRL